MRPKDYKTAITSIIVSFLCLVFPIIVPAANEVPSLRQAKAVSQGTLSNGISYYIVTNPAWSGSADVALVQKAGTDSETPGTAGMSSVMARASLTDLPHFTMDSPFQFLRRTSVWPEDEGYAKVGSNATVYRFRDLALNSGVAVLDSTLLMVFDIIGRNSGIMDKYYSPDNQAVIVSGDVDRAALVQKMEMLSMMVTKTNRKADREEYRWKESTVPAFSLSQDTENPGVSVSYRFPRTSREDMSTVIPLVTARYIDELGTLVENRVRTAMRDSGIPCRSAGFSYTSSAVQPGDESFTVSVGCKKEDVLRTVGILAGVLSDIDRNGLTASQYRDIRGATTLWLRENYSHSDARNSRWVDKCIGNFLYGASLATDKDDYDFFTGKKLAADTSASLFNTFAQALLDRDRNLSVICKGDTNILSGKVAENFFRESWNNGSGIQWGDHSNDTTYFRRSYRKTKVRTTTPEPMLGGTIWTFANGIKVVFKELDNSGTFTYSWLVKGGYSLIEGADAGTGSHVADMLTVSRIEGEPGSEFLAMLHTNGISMNPAVSYSDFRLSGTAPSRKLPLLLRSLAALAYGRANDPQAFEYYRKCGTGELPDNFPELTKEYFDDAFSRMDDGVLVVAGDFSAEDLKKTLSGYLGSFKTAASPSFRFRAGAMEPAGTLTKSSYGPAPEARMTLAAPLNFTTENYVAAVIAAQWLGNQISRSIAQQGWKAEASWDVAMFPAESIRMDVVLSPVSPSGMPASMDTETSPRKIVDLVRKGLSDASSKGISALDLAVARGAAVSYFDTWQNDPETICEMLLLRYSYGKDIVTDFKERTASVDSRRVNEIIRKLAGSAGDEVLVYGPEQKVVEPWVPAIPPLDMPKVRPVMDPDAYPLEGERVPYQKVDLSAIKLAPFVPGKFVMTRQLPADTMRVELPDIDIDALFSELGI